MRYSAGKTKHFHLGVEVFESYQHVNDTESKEYIGLCIALGFWHVDIEFPKEARRG